MVKNAFDWISRRRSASTKRKTGIGTFTDEGLIGVSFRRSVVGSTVVQHQKRNFDPESGALVRLFPSISQNGWDSGKHSAHGDPGPVDYS
jgi:hypothetical protein